MRIGPYPLSPPLVLAPMAGVTDRPFRTLCRRLGAGMAVSEMVGTRPELRNSIKTRLRLDHRGEAEPRWVQIVGTEPRMMAEAARRNVAEGAQIIDINMGCPAKKVCNKAAGSALLRDEALVGRILEAVVTAVSVPVTLKIRTGWSPAHRNAVRIARLARQTGIQALAIHGRTRACGFSGEAEFDTLREVRQAVDLPIIANGDISHPAQGARILAETGADALMIGRAALGNPWIFSEIAHYLATGRMPEPPPPEQVKAVMLEHLEAIYAFYGQERGYRVARKHIDGYLRTRLDTGAAALWRQRLLTAEGRQAQLRVLNAFFEQRRDAGGLAA